MQGKPFVAMGLNAEELEITKNLGRVVFGGFKDVMTTDLAKRFGRGAGLGAITLGGLALAHNFYKSDEYDYNKTKAATYGAMSGIAATALWAHIKDPRRLSSEIDTFTSVANENMIRSGRAAKKAWDAVNIAGKLKAGQVGEAVAGALHIASKAKI